MYLIQITLQCDELYAELLPDKLDADAVAIEVVVSMAVRQLTGPVEVRNVHIMYISSDANGECRGGAEM